jgi:hypothetical protein
MMNNNEMPVANFPNHAHEVCEDYDGVLVAFSEDIEHDVDSPHIVITSKSSFISGRLIQDSFKIVQASTKIMHARRQSCLLLKINIARAFDVVAWPFILEILHHMGYPNYWLNWVSAILASASTKALLNSSPGHRICHARGL